MEQKIVASIQIIKVSAGEVTYVQECPPSKLCVGGTVKEGGRIDIYEHEITEIAV